MASGENIVPEETAGSEDTPDGYHVGLTYESGIVWFYHLLLCRRPKPDPKAF